MCIYLCVNCQVFFFVINFFMILRNLLFLILVHFFPMLQYLFNSSFGGAEYLLANYRGEGMESNK